MPNAVWRHVRRLGVCLVQRPPAQPHSCRLLLILGGAITRGCAGGIACWSNVPAPRAASASSALPLQLQLQLSPFFTCSYRTSENVLAYSRCSSELSVEEGLVLPPGWEAEVIANLTQVGSAQCRHAMGDLPLTAQCHCLAAAGVLMAAPNAAQPLSAPPSAAQAGGKLPSLPMVFLLRNPETNQLVISVRSTMSTSEWVRDFQTNHVSGALGCLAWVLFVAPRCLQRDESATQVGADHQLGLGQGV